MKESFQSIFIKDQLKSFIGDTQLGHLAYRTMKPLKNDEMDIVKMNVRISGAGGIYATVVFNSPNWSTLPIRKDFSRKPRFGQRALINMSVEIHNYLQETMLQFFHTELLYEYIEALPEEYVDEIEELAFAKGYETCYQNMTVEDVEKVQQLMKDHPQKVAV